MQQNQLMAVMERASTAHAVMSSLFSTGICIQPAIKLKCKGNVCNMKGFCQIPIHSYKTLDYIVTVLYNILWSDLMLDIIVVHFVPNRLQHTLEFLGSILHGSMWLPHQCTSEGMKMLDQAPLMWLPSGRSWLVNLWVEPFPRTTSSFSFVLSHLDGGALVDGGVSVFNCHCWNQSSEFM